METLQCSLCPLVFWVDETTLGICLTHIRFRLTFVITSFICLSLNSSPLAGPAQREDIEEAKEKYQSIVGEEAEILVVQLPKFSPNGGLGLSLEGFTQGTTHYACM